jgi:fructose 1,6-bisphosphatase
LTKGRELGLRGPLDKPDPRQLGDAVLVATLDLRQLDYPFSERGAEPIVVAKALNGSWGFFNRALFNLFFNSDKGSGHRIEGNDFRAVVQSVADLRAGKPEVRTFVFGPGQSNELLALVTIPMTGVSRRCTRSRDASARGSTRMSRQPWSAVATILS